VAPSLISLLAAPRIHSTTPAQALKTPRQGVAHKGRPLRTHVSRVPHCLPPSELCRRSGFDLLPCPRPLLHCLPATSACPNLRLSADSPRQRRPYSSRTGTTGLDPSLRRTAWVDVISGEACFHRLTWSTIKPAWITSPYRKTGVVCLDSGLQPLSPVPT